MFICRHNRNQLWTIQAHLLPIPVVVGSVAFTSTNYDAFEADGAVDVCIFSAATAFERNITVLLTSQDGNATSEKSFQGMIDLLLAMKILRDPKLQNSHIAEVENLYSFSCT